MIKIRVSGNKKSTDYFFQVMNDLITNGVLSGELKDKEYPNYDMTIRRYFDVTFLKPADKEPVDGLYMLSARISSINLEEVMVVLNIFMNIGKVYYKSKGHGLDIRCRKGTYTAMVCLMSNSEAAKRTLMNSIEDDWKEL